ncbi:hypothetical protein [Crocosphaera sp.]|uniref:hypothetical protein n=1 Tax=Crocosphaera sp. TaxID=2729996 RepID=UPI00262BEBEE|nr:hypothetical protein [Crocosphaera sp.]MDJ0580050.1 hypothetical protein [Crocosphaera sp.]
MSRKMNRNHAKRQQRPMMEDRAIAGQLEVLLSDAIANQRKYCRELGLRDRILTNISKKFVIILLIELPVVLWKD